MTKLKELKKRLMEDPEFRGEYGRIDDEFKLIEALVRARTAAKLDTGGTRPAPRSDPVGYRAAGGRRRVAFY